MQTNIRFLVVDDFPTMRRIIRTFLNELGYTQVVEADGGLTALPLIETAAVDFVITDWNMPGMGGLALLRELRKSPASSKLPVLMVTAEINRQRIAEATQAGANGYMVKPFTMQTLKQKIDEILADLA